MESDKPFKKRPRQDKTDEPNYIQVKTEGNMSTISNNYFQQAKNLPGQNGAGRIPHWERLPPRWLYCPKIGKVIHGKFLPMKTPLDATYDHLITDSKYIFHPDMALSAPLIGAPENTKIGLWIDLTNSENYYQKSEIENAGIIYRKLRCVGHRESPSREQTEEFLKVVKDFFNVHPNEIVAVHCTHGFNRTGFLIAAYLYEEEGVEITMGVEEFAKCRPIGIYKQLYLDDLVKRYGYGDVDEEIKSLGKPDWGPTSDEDLNGPVINFQESNSRCSQNSTPTTSAFNLVTSNLETLGQNLPKFMEGKVPSVTYVEKIEERKYLQNKIKEYCKYKKEDFPGSQPVSLERELNLHLLSEKEYMVSWKADGFRYMILIEGPQQVYAFDRDNNVFCIPNLVFPKSNKDRNLIGSEHLRDTLLDAEMVIDKVVEKDKTQEIPRLLIYDIIVLQGVDYSSRSFPRRDGRFDLIKREIIDPRTEVFTLGKYRRENELISVRRKDFLHIAYTGKFFKDNFSRSVTHDIDGLIFQPPDPYTAGRFNDLLKWKPPEHATVDFRLVIVKIVQNGCLPVFSANLYVMGHPEPFSRIPATKTLQQYNNKIIECRYNLKTASWEFVRERTDKSHPNAYHTAESVCRTIRFPVTKDYLLQFIANSGYGVHEELERAARQKEAEREKRRHSENPPQPHENRVPQS